MTVFNKNMRLLLLAVAFTLSFAAMMVAFAKDSVIYAILGLPGLSFTLSLLHETGHFVACCLCKQSFKELVVYFVSLSKKGIRFVDEMPLKSYCVFSSGQRNAAIYAAGPIASALVTLFLLFLAFKVKKTILFFYSVCSFVMLVSNLIPRKDNDAASLIRTFKERIQRK